MLQGQSNHEKTGISIMIKQSFFISTVRISFNSKHVLSIVSTNRDD